MRKAAWPLGALALIGLAVALPPFFSREEFLDPARPVLSADLAPLSEVPTSLLGTPIRIPIATLVAQMESAVPTSYGDLEEPHGSPDDSSRTDVAFQLRRGPFQAEVDADIVTLRATISYALRAIYDAPLLPDVRGSCGAEEGDLMPRLLVTLRAPIAVDADWKLRTNARVMEVRPASDTARDQCQISFLGIDVTERVAAAAFEFLAEHTYQIDSIAAAADIRSSFEGWWRTLQEPIRLTDSLWLAMRPESVRQGSVRGTGDSLDINVALRARPAMVYGPRPTYLDTPLPSLDTGDVPEGLDLIVDGRIEYEAASALLFDLLGGREFVYGGRTLTLETLRVFGIGGGRLAVESVLAGDVSARLFLVGTPDVDPRTGQITVPDLDFDVNTRDVVLAAASWFRADDFRDVLRQEARWPAGPAVDWLTGWLVEGLNRDLSDDLRVEGEVDSVRVLSVHALQEVLLVRVSARGAARLFVGEGLRR
ncbi:MAG: DUF4403 family protein [Longimicrobiales bacterium]